MDPTTYTTIEGPAGDVIAGFALSATAADVVIVGLIAAILISLWAALLMALFVERARL